VKVYEHWMTNIRDWCISGSSGGAIASLPTTAQQRDATGWFVARSMRNRFCPKCGKNAYRQDDDVLDTWFLFLALALFNT